MMMSGVHDYDRAQRAAMRRESLPTLAEVMAASPMVTVDQPDGEGGLAPARLPSFGWAADGDRDSAQAAQLAILVKSMDDMSDDLITGRATYSAQQFADQWQSIRKITQSNQTGETK